MFVHVQLRPLAPVEHEDDSVDLNYFSENPVLYKSSFCFLCTHCVKMNFGILILDYILCR